MKDIVTVIQNFNSNYDQTLRQVIRERYGRQLERREFFDLPQDDRTAIYAEVKKRLQQRSPQP